MHQKPRFTHRFRVPSKLGKLSIPAIWPQTGKAIINSTAPTNPVAMQFMAYDTSPNADNGLLKVGIDTLGWVVSAAFNT